MAKNYVIFPELKERIKSSWLLTKYPDLEDFLWVEWEADNNEINAAFKAMNNGIKAEVWQAWNKAVQNDSHWKVEWSVILPKTWNDLLLATWEYLDGTDIPDKILLDFKSYWFNSTLEMIMSLSAYRASKEWYEWITKVHSWTTNRIKTILWYWINWETKIFQENIYSSKVISPFWTEVQFMPRKLVWINEVYNDESVRIFAILLRFSYEIWVIRSIFWSNQYNLKEILKGRISKEWEGVDNYSITNSQAEAYINSPLWNSTHWIPHWPRDEDNVTYSFRKVWNSLRVYTISQASYNGEEVIIDKNDCIEMLYWIIKQSPHPWVLLKLLWEAKKL